MAYCVPGYRGRDTPGFPPSYIIAHPIRVERKQDCAKTNCPHKNILYESLLLVIPDAMVRTREMSLQEEGVAFGWRVQILHFIIIHVLLAGPMSC